MLSQEHQLRANAERPGAAAATGRLTLGNAATGRLTLGNAATAVAQKPAGFMRHDLRFGGAKTGVDTKDRMMIVDFAEGGAEQKTESGEAFEVVLAVGRNAEEERAGMRDRDAEDGGRLWDRGVFATISWEKQPGGCQSRE